MQVRFHAVVSVILLLTSYSDVPDVTRVHDSASLTQAARNLRAGQTILLGKGVYSNVTLILSAHGSKERPIIVRSETPGSVSFEGNSSVQMRGRYTELSGIRFINGTRKPSDWKTHGPGLVAMYASHCRVTNCLFNNFDEADSAYITTSLTKNGEVPTHCRIDRNSFTNKLTFDQVINLNNKAAPVKDGSKPGPPMYHRVDHNYFSNPKKVGNAGGGIRIGYDRSDLGRCLVDYNVFERQDSESEIITSKSQENVFFANTFLNCQGTMNFRHGDHQAAVNNVFVANATVGKGFGGMYVWGSKHLIAGNFFDLSKTLQNRGRASLYLNCGAVGSEHALAFDSVIASNVFVQRDGYAINLNPMVEERKQFCRENKIKFEVPREIHFVSNVFVGRAPKAKQVFILDDFPDQERNLTWTSNTFFGSPVGVAKVGALVSESPEMTERGGVSWPGSSLTKSALLGLPLWFDSIEGIDLSFSKVVSAHSGRQLRRKEDVIVKWMWTITGDYGKTGKLSPNLQTRLDSIMRRRLGE